MGMRMKFDYTESQRPLLPEGEYQLRFKSKVIEKSKKGNDMITTKWEVFNPPNGVDMEIVEKVNKQGFATWVSLAPNALFTLKGLAFAAEQPITCSNCNHEYSADLEVCPACASPIFEVDLDFIDQASPGVFIEIKKDQKGEKDVNSVKKFFTWDK